MSSLNCEAFIFDPRPRYPLVVTAKRYWREEYVSEDPDALTLVFAHGTGFHKEHWEPTLEHLYEVLAREQGTGSRPVKLREAWSIDCPNHGDAAVLNERELQWGYSRVFGWEEYARIIHAFLTGLGTGVPVDFSTRKLVGIGHSMGAIALMLAETYSTQLKFASLILVDPMLLPSPPPGAPEGIAVDLPGGAEKRRDIWPSRAGALESLQSRASFKIWDPRVLKIFVEQGLRDLPTANYPDKTEGVTLKCHKLQEAACYRDGLGRTRAYKYLPIICSSLPVHFIYGAIDDYIPSEVKDIVLNVAAQGKYASVARIPGAGHLVPQMRPNGLADAIWASLLQDSNEARTGFSRARL